jgi:hypothetical protein
VEGLDGFRDHDLRNGGQQYASGRGQQRQLHRLKDDCAIAGAK